MLPAATWTSGVPVPHLEASTADNNFQRLLACGDVFLVRFAAVHLPFKLTAHVEYHLPDNLYLGAGPRAGGHTARHRHADLAQPLLEQLAIFRRLDRGDGRALVGPRDGPRAALQDRFPVDGRR